MNKTILACLFLILNHNLATAEINNTTDRFIRDKYGCMISTNAGLKPKFDQTENAWASWMTGYADLNNDGFPEIIAGYEHEYSEGYGKWTRKPYQYGFYSNNPEFKHPSGTKFLAARTMLTQDFNGDGRDDVVFVQHGPDFKPYKPASNEILISSSNGYKTKRLVGGKSLYHGGAAGDFDNDGDVDIIVTPGSKNELKVLLNDGTGTFNKIRKITGVGRNYNVKTWDIDGDGKLDIIFDGHTEPVRIMWGLGNGKFKDSEIKFEKLNHLDILQDAVFVTNSDGTTDIIINSSVGIDDKSPPYYGFSIDKITFSGRELLKSEQIERFTSKKYGRDWINFIHACDLRNDGKIDIVFEAVGDWRFGSLTDKSMFLDKIVWQNLGSAYKRHLIFDSKIHLSNYSIPSNFFKEEELANMLGLSLKKYFPAQKYAQKPYGKSFYQRYRSSIENILVNKKSSISVAKPNDSSTISPRVKALLEKRKKARESRD